MAIGIYRSLTFGGIDSATYGVYITGEAVYNSPARSVEMVSVPGRNGAVLLDNGYFENIEVSYPAGIPGTDQSDFATKISDFRNAILSQVGYQRLTDEYNPDEYRMATYISGLEVQAVEGQQGTAGEFELVFNCKPQRFLTSGEAAVAVANNGTITNPTLFDSRPLLQLNGYGNIAINGAVMSISSGSLGKIYFSKNTTFNTTPTTITITDQYINPGDPICIKANLTQEYIADKTISTYSGSSSGDLSRMDFSISFSGDTMGITARAIGASPQFTHGTPGSITSTLTLAVTMTDNTTVTLVATGTVAYDGDDTFTLTISTGTLPANWEKSSTNTYVPYIYGISSQSRLGNPLYIDLDLGEAYKIENDVPISINSGVSLPMTLPTLPPGESTITYDNTYTTVKIVPRWWII